MKNCNDIAPDSQRMVFDTGFLAEYLPLSRKSVNICLMNEEPINLPVIEVIKSINLEYWDVMFFFPSYIDKDLNL